MNNRSTRRRSPRHEEPAEDRRAQLIAVTVDTLSDLGYVGSTLAQIAGRAGVSQGLVAHYFSDKDGLLEAAFRSLARRVSEQMRLRLHTAHTPRERIQLPIIVSLRPPP